MSSTCTISRTRVGCFIGDIFVGTLAYADDVTLIDPTARAIRCMLHVCEEFSLEFFVTFNAAKLTCVVVSTKPERHSESMEFSILVARNLCLLMNMCTLDT